MGYGYATARGAQLEQLGFGAGAATTTVTSGAVGVFGSLMTIGATGFAYDGLILAVSVTGSGRLLARLTADTGGGDQVIADSIGASAQSISNVGSFYFDLPIRVPAGATIKCQIASTLASKSVSVSVAGYGGSPNRAHGFCRVVSLTDFTGADPANPITLTGTTLTGWVTVAAASSDAVGYLWVAPYDTSNGTRVAGQSYIEIGYGTVGNEKALFRVPSVNNTIFTAAGFGIPCMIPAGTRIAARAQSSVADTHTVGVVCWGAQP